MKLLLIEDETRLAEALSALLRLENYDVDVCRDGISGLDAGLTGIYDVIVLDIMLPGKNGLEVMRELRRAEVKTPTLMLTARAELDDKVEGLDSGADDYLTKPFMTKELLARLRALLRRVTDSADGTLSFGDLSLSPEKCTLRCESSGQSVRLGEKEYRLLEYMMANSGRILSREQLATRIWGYDNEAEYNNVEVYVSFTRKKISFVESKVLIKSVRGMGYELQAPDV